MIMFLRRLAYRLAYRRGWDPPRPGSLLYSPTLDYEYTFKDSKALDAFWDAFRTGYEVGVQRRDRCPCGERKPCAMVDVGYPWCERCSEHHRHPETCAEDDG